MKGLGRNIKFWCESLGKTFALIYAMMLGMALVVTIFDGSSFFETFAANMVQYSIIVSFIIVVIYGFTNIMYVMPITVSMGSRRITSLIGKTIAEHLIALVSFAFAGVFISIGIPELGKFALSVFPGVIALFFCLMALGNFVAASTVKFGRVLGIIIYIVILFGAITVGTLVIAGSDRIADMAFGAPMALLTIIAVASVVLDLVSIFITYLCVRKMELKF